MDTDLIAPRYEPTAEFRLPPPAPFEFGIDTVTMAELLSAPVTLAILREHAAWAVAMAQSPQFAPFATISTLRDATPFLPMDASASLAATDAALKALPRSEWPADVR